MSTPLDQQPFANIDDLFDKVDIHDIIQFRDGEMFMAFSPPPSTRETEISETNVYGAYSGDGGATWSEPFLVADEQGNAVAIPFGSLVELKSGALGHYYQFGDGPWVRPPKNIFYQDTGLGWWFRRSEDRGKTWTMPISMLSEDERAHQSCVYTKAADHIIVTQTGRIVLPACVPMLGPRSSYPRYPLGPDSETSLMYSFALYSDDEGQTWHKSHNLIFTVLEGKYPGDDDAPALGKGGCYDFEEPTVVELSNGSLMMFGRSIIGRTFKSISVPDPMPWPAHHVWESFDTSGLGAGAVWRHPVPTPLACSRGPSNLKYIPALKAILCIWNQVSTKEIIEGISRHRLSTALSFDDGETWQYFKNLHSLDDVTYVEPPPVELLHGIYGHHYNQPTDLIRYHRAPGSARTCYPSCRVLDETVIIYYCTGGAGGEPPDPDPLTTVRRVLPISWFTEQGTIPRSQA